MRPPALWLDPGLTVITGPNGAGKSNLASSLDVARSVLAPHDHPESGRLDLYQEAGFEGAKEFTPAVLRHPGTGHGAGRRTGSTPDASNAGP